MEKKFTEGKWIDLGYCVAIDVADGISNICEMRDWVGDEEMCANAKLIAAAPDLLNRLNSIVLSVKAHPDYVNGQEGDEWHDIVELAEQTIKKATE